MSKAILQFCIIILILLSCSSFPKPDKDNSSILIIYSNQSGDQKIFFEGLSTYTFNISENGINHYKILPGNYSVKIPNIETIEIEISENTVTLFPRFSNNDTWLDMTPKTQLLVRDHIKTKFNYYPWYVSPFIGFGVYTPRPPVSEEVLKFKLDSNNRGSHVFVDNIYWGTTPIQVEIEAGKHYISLRKDGYITKNQYLNVSKNDRRYYEMVEGSSEEDKIETLIVPFINLGASDFDYISSIFSDTIALNLKENELLKIVKYPSELWSNELTEHEVIQYGEKVGAAIIVFGSFLANDYEILIKSKLLDVRTKLIKTSQLSTGESGLYIFDSIDTMAINFARDVNSILPEIGNRVIEVEAREIEIYNLEMRFIENDIMTSRNDYNNAFTLNCLYYSSTFIDIAIGPALQYEYYFTPEFSIPTTLSYRLSPGSQAFQIALGFDFRYHFTTPFYDIYMGLHNSITYVDYTNESNNQQYTHLEMGFFLDAGMKFYLHKSKSKNPYFIDAGFILPIFGWNYSLDNGSWDDKIFGIGTYCGIGVRL